MLEGIIRYQGCEAFMYNTQGVVHDDVAFFSLSR